MNGLFDAGLEVQNFLQEREWRFCTVGGLAVIRWGESRMTQDVDVCLLTGFRNETNFIDPLLKRFAARVPDARDFALRNHVLLLSASNGAPLDVSLAGIPLEEKMIERASAVCLRPRLLAHHLFGGRPDCAQGLRGSFHRLDRHCRHYQASGPKA